MPRIKLPVLWGNNRWIRDANGIIRPSDRIGKNNPNWIDYSNAPGESTASLRVPPYPYNRLRVEFTDQIIEKLFSEHEHCISAEPECIFTCGGTASGKTSAVDLFFESDSEFNEVDSYIRIDYDRLKHCLPEYEIMRKVAPKSAASYTQAESSKMAGKLFKRALQHNYNIVYEKTLAEGTHTVEEIKRLRRKNYSIYIIATHISEQEGQIRAAKRFKDGGRFVPPDIVSGIYKQVPVSLFQFKELVDTIVLFDNNGSKLRVTLIKDKNGIHFIDHSLYSSYLEAVGNDKTLI